MNIQKGDKFRLNSSNGMTYVFKVTDVSPYRAPEIRYMSEAYNVTEGGVCDDAYMCDAGFFDLCERISDSEYSSLRS